MASNQKWLEAILMLKNFPDNDYHYQEICMENKCMERDFLAPGGSKY